MTTVLGLGTDIVDVQRIRSALRRHGGRLKRRAFTEAEAAYCDAQADPSTHFAGRFAAKEAVLKALGCGWSRGVTWRDVEILPGSGPPEVRLAGKAREFARERGVREPILVSVSHDGGLAVGFAVLQGRAPGGDRSARVED